MTTTERELLAALSRLIDAAVDVYDGQSENFPELVKATEKACKVYEKVRSTGDNQ